MRLKISGILFDMDGVLVDSEPHHYEAETAIFRELGIEISPELRATFTGMSNRLMWKTVAAHAGLQDSPETLMARAEIMRLSCFENLQGLRPIEGIPDLLEYLVHKKIPVALASSSSRELIKLMLEKTGLLDYLTIRVSGDEVSAGKPEPDIFLQTARLIDVPAEECAVIEDSFNGVEAAARAGMTVLGYAPPEAQPQDLSRADEIFTSIPEISAFIMACINKP